MTTNIAKRKTDLLEAGAAALGIDLRPAQLALFQRYYDELVAWNLRVNLTSVTDWDEVQTRHFLDSISVVQAIPKQVLESGTLVDVGSGAGFPGIPLKIAFPSLRLTLVEATAKKTAFLSHMVGRLELQGVGIRNDRAETIGHQAGMRESFDVVTARAVASMNTLAELTLPFCKIGGGVIAQKGNDVEGELQEAEHAIATLGGRLKEVKQVDIKEGGAWGKLVVVEKIAATPEKYPRRPGMPAKRPLQ